MTRGVVTLLFALGMSFAFRSGARAQAPSEAERREALQLCYSTDVSAQRFCMRRIAELPVDDADARRALTHLARQPGAAGDDARVLYRVRYGVDVSAAAPAAGQAPQPPPSGAPPATPVPPPPGPVPPPSATPSPSPQAPYTAPPQGAPPQPPYAQPPYAQPPYAQPPAPPPQYGAQPYPQPPAPPPQYGAQPYPAQPPYPPQPPHGPPAAYTRPSALLERERPNDPSRIHLTNTGFLLGEEKRFFTFQGPALYEIGVGITDHLQIEATTIFPAAIISALITLKYGLRFEAGGLAIFGSLGGVYMPAFDRTRGGTGIFRGGAALSIGSPDTFFNVTGEVGGGFYNFPGLEPDEGGQLFALFSSAFNARISRTTYVRAEGLLPGVYRNGSSEAGFGAFGMAGWGFRFLARRMVVDGSFYYPLHHELWRIYEVWPIGLPWISVALPF